jgi:hypothetical protein
MARIYKDRFVRAAQCGHHVNHFQGWETGMDYFNRMFCKDLVCPDCNSKGGFIHKRRKMDILENVKKDYGTLDGLGLRKFVFTLASIFWALFRSREKLNLFKNIASAVVTQMYPGRRVLSSFHLFGDDDWKFFPHINVYVVERIDVPGGCKMKLSAGDLDDVKERYLLALNKAGYACSMVDVNYKFTLNIKQFHHGIRYFSRPCPDYDQLMKVKIEDVELYDFLISDEMRGFQYIRSSRGKVDASQYKEGAGAGLMRMEELKFVGKENFSHRAFIEKWRVYERIEIMPGWFCCRSGGFSSFDKEFLKSNGFMDNLTIHQ